MYRVPSRFRERIIISLEIWNMKQFIVVRQNLVFQSGKCLFLIKVKETSFSATIILILHMTADRRTTPRSKKAFPKRFEEGTYDRKN
jgi:hypothetical protein